MAQKAYLRKHPRLKQFRTAIAIGTKFGRLTVIKELRPGYRTAHLRAIDNRDRRYRCNCECGNSCVRFACQLRGQLKRARSQCCSRGCANRIAPGEAAFNALLCAYRTGAARVDRVWELTAEQARAIFQSPCFYCEARPSRVHQPSNGSNGVFLYNGIDRRDNRLGYTRENCVACCSAHNWMKGKMTEREFIEACCAVAKIWAGRIQLRASC